MGVYKTGLGPTSLLIETISTPESLILHNIDPGILSQKKNSKNYEFVSIQYFLLDVSWLCTAP